MLLSIFHGFYDELLDKYCLDNGWNEISPNSIIVDATHTKSRYRIEAENSELKHRYGYDVASSIHIAQSFMNQFIIYIY